jgi:hypothetical protein
MPKRGMPIHLEEQITEAKTQPSLWNQFSFRGIALFFVLFYGFFAIGNRLVTLLCLKVVKFDCPATWPISIFILRAPPVLYFPKPEHIVAAVLTSLLLTAGLILAQNTKYNIWIVTSLAFIAIIGSNLVQGWNFGFIRPIIGPDEYYTDAVKISNPNTFISNFVQAQPYLHMHSRSHPPGAVLLIYYFIQFFKSPATISIAIAVISILLTAIFFYRIAKSERTKEFSGFLVLLLLLLPSVQIYYLASIDAVVSGVLLTSVSLFVTSKSRLSTALSALFLFIASFLDFGFLFAIPVILVFEWLSTRKVTRSVIIILILISLYFVIYSLTGFNYYSAFRQASQIENPSGFMLLANPINYIMTRIEDIAEIVFFLGPFPVYLGIRSLMNHRFEKRSTQMALAGIGTLPLMFASGAFRTGETARAAIFIYPYLLLLVGESLTDMDVSRMEQAAFALLVFIPGIVMQLIGNYFW